ncbi:alpha/beta hydrolase family esterase [Kribbella italica]|uniref:Poly(Hydroxyalkanoate) depolymerase family esterase n=1 Tax=Kribbella italica TaxID=1540520 RepID=A0A7W9J4Z4_9ACTN|nr:PHB depolymerase family esterase [Kribbella italica]MBB5835731.1 poly(hydroxyalkanoate) depolymerase family esterase [Kribbella italica]
MLGFRSLGRLVIRRDRRAAVKRWGAAVVALAVSVCGLVPAYGGGRADGVAEVTGFGSNPGNLRMFRYVPPGVGPGRPLVVALHGCTQSAAAFDDEPGWIELARRLQFVLVLPQQQSANNFSFCFNWFQTADSTRGAGEPLSIKQMVDRARTDAGSDPAKVFVTGLSAGGAMAAIMAATYPDVFAGAAVVAGLPYRCATTLVQAYGCQNPGTDLSPRQWGDKVRAASQHRGPWPTLSVWHGTADTTVAYRNLTELAEQWTDVHGADQTADGVGTVNGYPHHTYRDQSGRAVVETWSITDMRHGQPIDPGAGPDNCGQPAPYILDVDVCAAGHIATFWGLSSEH